MADRSAWKIVEDLFKDHSAHIIAMGKVQECTPGVVQLAKSKKRILKISDQARILVLTGSWDKAASNVKLLLHVCRPSGMRFEIAKIFRMAGLMKLEVYLGEPGLANSIQAFEMTFAGDKGDSYSAFQVADEEMLLQILAPLWHFQTKFPVAEQKRPTLATYPGSTVSFVVQMNAWKATHLDKDLENRLTSTQHLDEEEKEADPDEESNKMSLVSAKEERDLQILLDKFTIEVHDLADFQQRLQNELTSLEQANVHAILESDSKVANVRDSLNDALALLDDVNENLATFDTKLLVMREDIAAIELRNNRLELQTRNNGKLLNTLDNLLGKLQLPHHIERALRHPQFTPMNLDAMVKAGWDLFDHLEGLSDEQGGGFVAKGISLALASMEAVASQRQRLASLANTYVGNATKFIGQQLTIISNSALPASNELNTTECSAPNHTDLQSELDELMALLQVVRALNPGAVTSLGEQYTHAFNTLLRRELHLYTAVLRRQIAAGNHISPPDVILAKSSKKDGGLSFTEGAKRAKSAVYKSGSQGKLAVENEEEAMQPHEAYEKLLREWVPFLKDEINTCVDFLMLKDESGQPLPQSSTMSLGGHDSLALNSDKPSLSGSGVAANGSIGSVGVAAIEAMLLDISKDFLSLVDMVSRQRQVQAVAMLATTLKWHTAVGDSAIMGPLQDILGRCGQRLLTSFETFLNDTVTSVNQFEPRGGLAHNDGLKGTHILPFVTNFGLMLDQLEKFQDVPDLYEDDSPEDSEEGEPELIGEGLNDDVYERSSDEENVLIREESLPLDSAADGQDDDTIRRQLRGSLSAMRHGPAINSKALQREQGILETSSSIVSIKAKRKLTEAEIPEHLPELRLITSVIDVVNPVYAILIRAILSAIQRIAALDTKHGVRLSLENYKQFESILRGAEEHNPVLAFFIKIAEVQKEKALQIYVQQQLEYGSFWQLIEFSSGLEELLSEVGPEEAPYQPGYQMHDLRHLLTSTFHHTEKRLSTLKARIQKHLNGKSDLVKLVWDRLKDKLLLSFISLLEQTDQLYAEVQAPITPDILKSLLVNTK